MKYSIPVILLTSLLFNSCATFFSAINYSPSQKVKEITFSDEPASGKYEFYYSDTTGNTYLRTLRQDYRLDSLVAGQQDEIEKIKLVLHWSSSQWEHNGSNNPSSSDALTILEEAKEGKQFRCVEYGIVAASGLNAIGIPSRPLNVKTRDVEKVKLGAGHVVTETYSKQLGKWLFIDPQFDIMPTLNGSPLNAVEFQQAIRDKKEILLVNADGPIDNEFAEKYLQWIGKYLYFLDITFDQRAGTELEAKTFEGKTKLMLVPVGVENPNVFQRKHILDYCLYTHNLNDFYQVPNE